MAKMDGMTMTRRVECLPDPVQYSICVSEVEGVCNACKRRGVSWPWNGR